MKIANKRVYKADSPLTLPVGAKKERKVSKAEQRKIDICLKCTKPANECKGSCFE